MSIFISIRLNRERGKRSYMSDCYHNFEKLCNDIFALSSTIRSAVVIDKTGKLVAGGMRQGIKSMEEKEDSQKLYVEFALRSVMREEFDKEFGKTIYIFSEIFLVLFRHIYITILKLYYCNFSKCLLILA